MLEEIAAPSNLPQHLVDVMEKLKGRMAQRHSVAILGSVKLRHKFSQAFIEALGHAFGTRLKSQVNFITGGNPGVQELFTKSLGPEEDFKDLVYHFLPKGAHLPDGCDQPCSVGTKLVAGDDWAERNLLLANIADVAVVIEGGPGAVFEATQAFKRTQTFQRSLDEASESLALEDQLAAEGGPLILCVQWTKGAAGGTSFEGTSIPCLAFLRHPKATAEEWGSLKDEGKRGRTPDAIVDIVDRFLKCPLSATSTSGVKRNRDEDSAAMLPPTRKRVK